MDREALDEPGPEGNKAPAELRDVSAELSALLVELARTPEQDVDVAQGWTPGLAPGDEVGRFVLKREIGRGGFGVVYEALDRELGRPVAFKALRPGRRTAAHSADWLRGEAEAVARLNHPNIVTLHDFGRGPTGPYLIFELLHGETLADRLRGGRLPLREAVAVATDVARVLAHAHKAGVVHRDLKPANVFLCEDGAVKVLDFGLAHLFGRAGAVSGGTPAYMAPEQWRNEPGDERSDLFSLGVLLFQMIAGRVPYRVTREHSEAQEPGPPPELPRDAAPAALRKLCHELLEKDPAHRPSTARGVLDALTGVQRRMEGRGGRRRLVWTALLAGLAVAFGAALLDARQELPGEGERLVVAVADFENGTGERELDGLSGLLVTSLEQSRRFQVLTRSRLLALLQKVGRPDAPRIDAVLARDLARAAQAKVLLVGSARRDGDTYALELEALDPLADRRIFSVRESAPAKAAILGALDRLSDAARRQLREREPDVRATRIRVAAALTGKIEAYQAYFEGMDCIERPSRTASWVSVDVSCAAHFRRALALDPTFALAHYQIAYLLGNAKLGDADLAAHMAAALRYVDRVPMKEAALVRAWSAHLAGKDEEALALYGTILSSYPEDLQALSISGDIHVVRGEPAAAVPFFEKVVSLDPGGEWPLDSLVNTLGALGRQGELESLLSRLAEGPITPATAHARVRGLAWLGDLPGSVETARDAVGRGFGRAARADLAGALHAAGAYAELERELRQRLEEEPDHASSTYLLATVLGVQGRRGEGLRVLDRLEARLPAAVRPEVPFVRAMYEAGADDPAVRRREAAKAMVHHPAYAGDLAVALALFGDLTEAEPLAELLPERSTVTEAYAALAQWRRGDGAGAAGRLAALDARDPSPWRGIAPSYLLAEVSADIGDWRATLAAVERFRRLWPRGSWRSWAVPRGHYLAALAHAELGEVDEARAELDALGALWARPDPGLRLSRQAWMLRLRISK